MASVEAKRSYMRGVWERDDDKKRKKKGLS